MYIEQIYTGCLAQGAYYIRSKGEAAIIDPLREVGPYLKKAAADGVEIKYIFETHFHADFVSGHLDLAKKTNAKIVFGPQAATDFDAYNAVDGEEFKIGDLTIKAIHTPGHTMESTTYLLLDESGIEHCIFTGDTLFIGDVGRPDLAQKMGELTTQDLAATLFQSLREKIMPLPNHIIVYPAHGAGSACGKNMSTERSSTLGEQKVNNYALRADMTQDEFVKELTEGLSTPPAYFPMNVAMNKGGYDSLDDVLDRSLQALSPEAFEAAANETSALILDTRNPQEFSEGFIPNSINIGIDGGFAPWVGAMIPDVKQKILLICELGREEETVTRLARVGFDFVIGYLEGGFASWKANSKEVDAVDRHTAEELLKAFKEEDNFILDVRKKGEYESGHVKDVSLIPLSELNENLSAIPKDKNVVIHCAGGYRSMIAASILKARGWQNVSDVIGGFSKIKLTAIPQYASTEKNV